MNPAIKVTAQADVGTGSQPVFPTAPLRGPFLSCFRKLGYCVRQSLSTHHLQMCRLI